MDCKDLMIGDWVSYKDDPPYIVRATSICKVVTIDNGIDHRNVMDDAINPISLTYEILVKNGFRYTANVIGRHNCKCYELEQKGVYHMTISIYKNEITCELDKIDALYMNVVTNCVHELQHLLRLCGVEKELIID